MRNASAVLVASVRWRRSSLAETDASVTVSAACYRRPEHVGITTVVVAELKFSDVQSHIFRADLVERADYAALENAPEAFNRVGVDCADNVFVLAVIDAAPIKAPRQLLITTPVIRRDQADLVRANLVYKIKCGFASNAPQNLGDDVAATFYRANDGRLVGFSIARLFVPMTVVIFAANPRLINLYNAAQLDRRIDQSRADFVAHGMGRLVTAEAHHALNLKGAHSLLARQHQMGDAIPVAERLFRVLKDGARQSRETIAVLLALAALPVKWLVAGSVVQVRVATARAVDAFRPAPRHKVFKASRIIPNRETRLKLSRGHLRDWFWLFRHDCLQRVGGYCHA